METLTTSASIAAAPPLFALSWPIFVERVLRWQSAGARLLLP